MDISKLSIDEKLEQCSKPNGQVGIEFGKGMNVHHKPLFDWGF